MKRIAVIGGGISGVAAAWQLARLGRNFTLFEASERLGGTVETVRQGEFVIECGPDSWITEKPGARELAIELGLEAELVGSNDQWRRTYLVQGKHLAAMPDGMRMMAPGKWGPLLESPMFSWQAKLAYLREPRRAEELKQAALADGEDESVASFVRRHFGDEVTDTIAAPLLAGVFGGSIDVLSARAVMGQFVKMEREHGSLITALQSRARNSSPVFTTLKSGLQTLVDRMAADIPAQALRLQQSALALELQNGRWIVRTAAGSQIFDAIIVATPAHVTRQLLTPLDARFDGPLTIDASSAIVVALGFEPQKAKALRIPRGFGFLESSRGDSEADPPMLACTFVDQKFAHRAPPGGVLLRGFFGGNAAPALLRASDAHITSLAHRHLSRILGPLPEPDISLVRRWPHSLPQYAIGHLARMNTLEALAHQFPPLHLIGNAYHGVGLPDLVKQGRDAARAATSS